MTHKTNIPYMWVYGLSGGWLCDMDERIDEVCVRWMNGLIEGRKGGWMYGCKDT